MKRVLWIALLLVALPAVAADKKPIEQKGSATVMAKIEAIDHDARTVTLKTKDGSYEVLQAGPEIKRFDELQVGDTVTFKYEESVAVRIRKPGEPVAAKSDGEPQIVRGTGAKPSGTMTQQVSAAVLVKAVDKKAGSLKFTTEDGRTQSVRVEDKKILKNVKPGDKIEVTYTNALIISVE